MVPVLTAALVVLAVAVLVLCALLVRLHDRIGDELRTSQALRDKLADALAALTTRGKVLEEIVKDLSQENTALAKTVASLSPNAKHADFLEGQVQHLQAVVISTLKENADLAQTRIMSLLDIRASALAHGQVRARQEAAGFAAPSRDGFTTEPPETTPMSTIEESPDEPRRRPGENKVNIPLSPTFTDSPYEPEEELAGTGIPDLIPG